MHNDDSFMIKLSEDEIRAMPVEEKLNVLLKITLPILAAINGNGKEGIKQAVIRHDAHLRYIWLILIPILGGMVVMVFKN